MIGTEHCAYCVVSLIVRDVTTSLKKWDEGSCKGSYKVLLRSTDFHIYIDHLLAVGY